jgi:hypothetical protein
MRANAVRSLLMGGQACVSYGAAEFSRDVDLALLADAENLTRLRTALRELAAEPVAVPPLDLDYLLRGHAIHFRCAQADGIRVDLMSVMRGVDPFPELWRRRTTIVVDEDEIDLLSLPDLVLAKKTQRDKDWPMIRRLLEAHYFVHRGDATPEQRRFWLQELRTPELLVELVRQFPTPAAATDRPAVAAARAGDLGNVSRALMDEQEAERARDRDYWRPLRAELEQLRRLRRG